MSKTDDGFNQAIWDALFPTSNRHVNGHRSRLFDKVVNNGDVSALSDLIHNVTMERSQLFTKLLDPRRDIDDECGYPSSQTGIGFGSLNPEFYRQLYERECIATRVVQVLPKECWQVLPVVYEDEDPASDTPFEAAYDDLARNLRGDKSYYQGEEGNPIYEHLKRADILSGIGHFGIVLIGIDDGLSLDQPVEGVVSYDPEEDDDEDEGDDEEAQPAKAAVRNFSIPTEEITKYVAAQRDPKTGLFTVNKVQDYPRNAPPGYAGTKINPSEPSRTKAVDAKGNSPVDDYVASGIGTDSQYVGVQLGPSEYPGAGAKGQKGKKHKLLFLRSFDESLVQIVQYEANVNNPRFGQPVMYRVTLNDPREMHSGIGLPMATVRVHWSRVVHLADNLGSSEIFGVPRMRPVLNRLLDLRKLYSGSAEMYWRGAFPGYVLSTHPQLGGDVELDDARIKDQMEQFMNGLQRYAWFSGLQMQGLAPQVVDPTPQINVQLEAICIQIGCPIRVFKGSERGELASNQDDASWNDRLKERQLTYVTPKILIPFIDRLIAMGVLPVPNVGKDEAPTQLNKPPAPPAGGGPPGAPGGGPPASPTGEQSKPAPPNRMNGPQPATGGKKPGTMNVSQGGTFNVYQRKTGKGFGPALPLSTTWNQLAPGIYKVHNYQVVYNAPPDAGAVGASAALKSALAPKDEDDEEDKAAPPQASRPGQPPPGQPIPSASAVKTGEKVVSKTPRGYSIEWPDLDSNSDKDKAGIALQETQAIAAYVSGNIEAIIPPHEYLTEVLGWDDEQAEAVLQAANAAQEAQETMTQPAMIQGLPAEAPEGTQAAADQKAAQEGKDKMMDHKMEMDQGHLGLKKMAIDKGMNPFSSAPPGAEGPPGSEDEGARAQLHEKGKGKPVGNVQNYSEDQPRDEHGRFGSGGSASEAGGVSSSGPTKDPYTPPPPGEHYNPDVEHDGNKDGVTDAARVGVPAMHVPPPPPIERMPNLTPDERDVEDDFISHYEKDPDGMAHNYRQLAINSAKPGDPPTFATDDAKALSPVWGHPLLPQSEQAQNRALYNIPLHATANAIAKRAFLEHLDTLKPGDELLVTNGGCGAGKGYVLKNDELAKGLKANSKAIWDSAGDQNATENPWIQKEAEARGLKVNYLYVHADPKEQWAGERGVVQRAQNPDDGRMVTTRVYADSHTIGARNHDTFHKDNIDNPSARFYYRENRGPTPISHETMPRAALQVDRHELQRFAKEAIHKKEGVPSHILRGGTLDDRLWG